MITAVSIVKNAADVIETMIRGNALVADSFYIVDHGSTDRTPEILESLKNEGFKINVVKDESQSHFQKQRMEKAIKNAITEFDPGFILPLDDDEIICTNDEKADPGSVKPFIENLSQDDLYYVNWRIYIPTEYDPEAEINVANRQRFCFDDEPEMTKKVIIPAKIAKSADFQIAQGNHFAESTSIRNHVLINEIRLAHYPVRSSLQIASKAVIGWLGHLTMPNIDPDTAIHWHRMYDVFKSGGGRLPSVELMQAMCTLYREYPNDEEHLNIIEKPIGLPDEVLTLKYTGPAEVNILINLLNYAENLAVSYAREKADNK